jgi:ppGpp synthetase/RelA/SpoT-type nucleotidyltranferase
MSDLDDVRKRWIEHRPRHEEYGRILASRITASLRRTGVWFEVTSRAKSIDSLIKKLIKKPAHSYESLPDKLGVRVIVRYRSDLDIVIPAITEVLHCGVIDPKTPAINSVGYLSFHVDFARLKESDPEHSRFPVSDFWAELQLRTQAQHLWSEMSHDSIYKNDETIVILSDDIKRRVNLMAGQIEIADREFDRLARETKPAGEAEVLHFLEPIYYRLTSSRPDVELSLMVLRLLLPLYREDVPSIEQKLKAFLDKKVNFLETRYSQAQQAGATPVSPLFFQPEALMIYERLAYDDIALRQAWSKSFPAKELERLAKDFGFSFQ